MTPHEVEGVIKAMAGYWPTSEASLVARGRWLNDHGVEFSDAIAVLEDMAMAYERLPSVKDIAVKLAERGADARAPVGVGSRVVIERMKTRIEDTARVAADRQNMPLVDRLRNEQSAAKDYLEESISCGLGMEACGYWSDMVKAYAELLS